MSNKKEFKPGVIYTAGEPEYIGTMPIRTDIEILPADEPGREPIGWKVYIRDGGEVYLEIDPETPLTSLKSIEAGDKVLVPTMFGISLMTVTEVNGNEAFAETEGSIAPLKFANDDRDCWTCSSLINKKSLNAISEFFKKE